MIPKKCESVFQRVREQERKQIEGERECEKSLQHVFQTATHFVESKPVLTGGLAGRQVETLCHLLALFVYKQDSLG